MESAAAMNTENASEGGARELLRVLLIEDDEDDHYLIRLSLDEAFGSGYALEWVRDYEAGRVALLRCGYDVCLLDDHLGQGSGLNLLREAHDCRAPVIMLTANTDYDADFRAMKAGVSDYLLKGEFSPRLLERSIRYAIERRHTESELEEYRENLERLVHQRTAELEDAYQRLLGEMSERERAEEALRESEARHRILIEDALDIIYTISIDGIVTSLNPAFETITGWSVAEWVGRDYSELVHPEDLPVVRDRIRGLIRNKSVPPAELRIRSKSGDYRTLEFRTSAQFEGPKVRGVHGVARDITMRKRSEEALQARNAFLNHVIESLTHPFYVLDANTYRVEMANSAARAETPLHENMPCYVLHGNTEPCTGADHVCTLQRVKQTKAAVRVEHIHRDREGNPRHVEVYGYPIFDERGEVAQVIEYSLDISERKRLEVELRQNAEKTKLFAYSVSHDLKSPLVGIVGLTRILHRKYAGVLDEAGGKFCDQILKASEQALRLVEEINAYVRSKELPLQFERIRPGDVLKTVRAEFAALLGVRQVTWLEPDTFPEIVADRVSLLRIFRNLIDNAFKYGGEYLSRITIGLAENADTVTFSVSDDGVGLGKQDCETVFEIFERTATSKGSEGTGLGLAIVKELVVKHRGRVWVESGNERGATFYFSLSKKLKEVTAPAA